MTVSTTQGNDRSIVNVVLGIAALLLAILIAGFSATPAFAADSSTTGSTDVAQVTTTDGKTTTYGSLKDAVAAAPSGATITLLADESLPAYSASGTSLSLEITKPVTIDGAGHTLTVAGRGVYITGSDDESSPSAITMRNITIVNNDGLGRVVSARNGYKTLAFEDVIMRTTGAGNTQVFTVGGNTPQVTPITFAGCTLEASQAGYGIITLNPVDMTIADTDVSGYGALYIKGKDASAGSNGSTINITAGSNISSKGIAGTSNVYGTIVFAGAKDVTVNVEDSTVTAEASSEEPPTAQNVVMFSTYGDDDKTIADNNTVNFGEGSTVNAIGANSALLQGNGNPNKLNATGGTFHLEGNLLYPHDATLGTELAVTGGTWNKDMSAYEPDGTPQVEAQNGIYVVGDTDQGSDGRGTDASTDPSDTNTDSSDGGSDGGSDPVENAGDHSDSANTIPKVATPLNEGTATQSSEGAPINGTQASQLQQSGDDTPWALAGIGIVALLAFAGMTFALLRRRSA